MISFSAPPGIFSSSQPSRCPLYSHHPPVLQNKLHCFQDVCTQWCHSLDLNTVFQGHTNHTYLRIPYSVCMVQRRCIQLQLAREVDSDVFIYIFLINLQRYCSLTWMLTLLRREMFSLQGWAWIIDLLRFHWIIILWWCSQLIFSQRVLKKVRPLAKNQWHQIISWGFYRGASYLMTFYLFNLFRSKYLPIMYFSYYLSVIE